MISAIVVAAGSSTRMGAKNKLLLPYKGKALFLHIIDALLPSKISEIVVVTGHESEKIEKQLKDRNVKTTYNPNFKNGLTSSIQTGISTCEQNTDAYLICLSDMPFIKTTHIDKLLTAFDKLNKTKGDRQIVIPKIYINRNNKSDSKWSHPILFSSFYKDDLLNNTVSDGCKTVIQKNKKNISFVNFTEDFSRDIDTPEAYQNIINEGDK